MMGLGEKGTHMRGAAMASLAVSLLLVVIKGVAYFATDSVAVLASLADSALDLFTSGLNLFAIHEALTPADAEHRFGHGKAEPLAGLGQGAFIAASALFLVIQAASRILHPQPIDNGGLALTAMGVSIAAATALVLYQRHVVRRTGSLAVAADQTHYFGDLVSNVGVVVAVLLSSVLGWQLADPIIALTVAAVLVASAWVVFRQSLDQLMDREIPEEERQRIIAVMLRHPELKALHELKTRKAGLSLFIQAHIELDPDMTLSRAHAISDAVEHDLLAEFPGADVIIHQDPAGLEQPLDASESRPGPRPAP